MAAPQFRSAGTPTANTPSAGVSLPAPAGVVVNDIVLVHLHLEATPTSLVTRPTGFLEVTPFPYTTGDEAQQRTFWKRATSSEPSSYAFSFGSAWNDGVVTCWSGCATDVSPFETPAIASRSTSDRNTPPVSLTTSGSDRLLVWVGGGYNRATWTAPTGYTGRVTGSTTSVAVASKSQPTAGATGSVSGLEGTSTYQTAWLIPLIPPSAPPPSGPEAGRFLITRGARR